MLTLLPTLPLKLTVLPMLVLMPLLIQVSVKESTPPERKTLGKVSFQSTKSGGEEQSLLQDGGSEACQRLVFFHRYRHERQGKD